MTETRDFQLQTTQMLEVLCLFSFKSILQENVNLSTACMLNLIYIVQSK